MSSAGPAEPAPLISLELTEPAFGDLDSLVEAKRAEYQSAEPFPHVCFENLFSNALLEKVVLEMGQVDADDWKLLEKPGSSRKRILEGYRGLGPYSRYLFNAVSTPPFLRFVEEVTGLSGLIADPYLHGGGVHEISSGGSLELHSDFNWHGHLKMYRRLNFLLYLNKDWKEEYEGGLELWDRKLQKSKVHYPLWNRLVIQSVTADAMHGFPKPIRCPEDMTRKSVAMWYYTTQLPVKVQLGYDLCEPDFIRRAGGPAPLPRPLWRRLLPPVVTAYVKKKRQTKTYSPLEVKSALTRFVPPILVEGYERLRGNKV